VGKMIKFKKVDSSALQDVRYKNRVLELRFSSGALYRYEKVSPHDYHKFYTSESLGKGYNSFIRPTYKGIKVEESNEKIHKR
jgi:hypothetical protein